MSRPVPSTYRTTNRPAYNAALRQRGSLLIWLDPGMERLAAPRGRRGHPATFSDAAIQTGLMLKALFGLPRRQATGRMGSLLRRAKLDWPVPGFSTLCRRQRDLAVALPCRPSAGALPLLIDSTGIKAMGEGEWSCRRHGASRPRQWCRLHPGIDAEALEIRAIEGEQANATGPGEPANGSRVGDGPMLPRLLARLLARLLERIPPEEPIGPVTADGACDTRACHAAIAARQATAVTPTRRNGRPWGETAPGAQARNDILRTSRRFGRALGRNRSGDHRRRLTEARRRCLKLPGERPSARTTDRQTAELQIRAALLSRFTALGTPKTTRAA